MDFSPIQIKLTIPPTPKPNNEVVEVDDGEGDVPENVVAPQVVEGDGLPQVEEAMIMRRMQTLSLKNGKLTVFLFYYYYFLSFFKS